MTVSEIREVLPGELDSVLEDLSNLLHSVVEQGASVGFILPYSVEESRTFWRESVFSAVKEGKRALFVAELAGRIVGTVQLNADMLPNQMHRCEVNKLLVHPNARRQGIAKELMKVVERKAHALNRHLITLDTRTGDAAEPLYQSLGYETVGVLPGFCRATEVERYDGTTYMYKSLQ